MISRDSMGFTLVCDVCNTEAEETFDEFQDAVDFKKENGWRSRKAADGWQDLCPDCVKRGGQ